jgi:NAD(P)-dependent dehydrogenase (short-subunit alcohol dehydrogenase family)
MRSCVVTGVSSGIGEAIAADLVKRGWRVFGTVRRMDDAERLDNDLGPAFTPLVCDVTDVDGLSRAAAAVAGLLDGKPLDGLVCNAGISLPGPLLHQPLDELDRQWKVNVLGQIATVQAFAPLLGAQEGFAGKPGRIVMMSSVSGRLSWPFVGGYSASKHALEAMSHSLRRELMPFGVDVVIVGPGPIATPIWEKAAAAVEKTRYQATFYGPRVRPSRLVHRTMLTHRRGFAPQDEEGMDCMDGRARLDGWASISPGATLNPPHPEVRESEASEPRRTHFPECRAQLRRGRRRRTGVARLAGFRHHGRGSALACSRSPVSRAAQRARPARAGTEFSGSALQRLRRDSCAGAGRRRRRRAAPPPRRPAPRISARVRAALAAHQLDR